MLKMRSGIVALALASILLLQGAVLAQGQPAAAGTAKTTTAKSVAAPGYTRALKRGCKGADVKTLQQKLTELKFYKKTCDGSFGASTESAVKSFQKAHGLKSDGVVGQGTYKAIYGTSSGTGGSGSDSDYKLGSLNNQVTLKKGSKGSNVKDLQAVLKMKHFYSGAITGSFQTQTQNAVMSFQHSVGLKADGIAANYTLSALYTMLNPPDLSKILPWPDGKSAYANIKIEKLDWWNEVSNSAFKKGLEAVVVDVRSGYTFHIKRTGGTNHADVETLTPTDTATFYKAAGNFSWDRHPIWVIVNGRRLAASMNCMPHGYDSISGNDMKGQFCIHFVRSRTHGSDKVDPDHQACIEEAYEAGLAQSAAASPTPSASVSPTPTISPSPTPTTTGAHVTSTPTATPTATHTTKPTPTPTDDGGQQPPPW